MALLGNQQLPPEHVGVAERFILASRKGRVVELNCTFDVKASQKSTHCSVMSLLLCSFSSSRRASYHLSHASSGMPSLTYWFRFRLQQFLDLCHLLHCLSHPESGFGYFVSGLPGLPYGHPPATCWLRRPRPAPDPALYVPPPSCWDDVSPRRSPVSSGRLAGSSDLALVVGDGSAQLARISLSRAICRGLTRRCRDPFAGILSLSTASAAAS